MEPKISDVLRNDIAKLEREHREAISELNLTVATIDAALHEILGEPFGEAVLRLGPLLRERAASQLGKDRERQLNEIPERLKQILGPH
jgi:hypothetical protein